MERHVVVRIGFALLLGFLLVVRGLEKKSLNRNGAIAAFLVGVLTFSASYRFGKLIEVLGVVEVLVSVVVKIVVVAAA